MLRYTVLGAIGLIAGSAWAQQAAPGADTAATSSSLAASTQPSKAVLPMEEPQPGDYWTYETRDEITGKISATRTNVVTDVTPKEINTRVDTLGKLQPRTDHIRSGMEHAYLGFLEIFSQRWYWNPIATCHGQNLEFSVE